MVPLRRWIALGALTAGCGPSAGELLRSGRVEQACAVLRAQPRASNSVADGQAMDEELLRGSEVEFFAEPVGPEAVEALTGLTVRAPEGGFFRVSVRVGRLPEGTRVRVAEPVVRAPFDAAPTWWGADHSELAAWFPVPAAPRLPAVPAAYARGPAPTRDPGGPAGRPFAGVPILSMIPGGYVRAESAQAFRRRRGEWESEQRERETRSEQERASVEGERRRLTEEYERAVATRNEHIGQASRALGVRCASSAGAALAAPESNARWIELGAHTRCEWVAPLRSLGVGMLGLPFFAAASFGDGLVVRVAFARGACAWPMMRGVRLAAPRGALADRSATMLRDAFASGPRRLNAMDPLSAREWDGELP